MFYNLLRSLICAALLFSANHCFGISYVICDLGLNENCYASSINEQGVIAGKVLLTNGEYHDFFWTSQSGSRFTPFQTSVSLPVVNDKGMIGAGWFASNSWFDYFTLKQFYSVDFKGDKFQEIPPPEKMPVQKLEDWQTLKLWDDKQLAVLDLNEKGQFLISDHFDPVQGKIFALWNPTNSFWGGGGRFEMIEEKNLLQPSFINNQGIVLGKHWESRMQGSPRYIAIFDPSTGITTPLFIDKGCTLTGFNDKGQICGWKMKHIGSPLEGFLYDPENGLQPLGNFLPTAINNHGQMVGHLKTDETDLNYFLNPAFDPIAHLDGLKRRLWTPSLWVENRAVPLKEIVDLDNLSFTILKLSGINDRGDIIGQALLDQKIQVVLLKPSP